MLARMNITEIAEFHNVDIKEAELIVDGDAEKQQKSIDESKKTDYTVVSIGDKDDEPTETID